MTETKPPQPEEKAPPSPSPETSAGAVSSAPVTPPPSTNKVKTLSIHDLLKQLVDNKASDLHITSSAPPHLRLDGKLLPIKDIDPLHPNETEALCFSILNREQREAFQANNELDFSFGIRGLARFRASIFRQRGSVGGVFRIIPFRIRSLQELGLPKVISNLSNKPRGLILVTGSAGSGKSTTLAALIDQINRTKHGHIVTIEDPIEFVHKHQKCLINQREIGADAHSFASAIRQVLRLDPDVVQVGEIRDQESMLACLSLAETGHLVLATLHTNSAVQSIHRVIDFFPQHQQDQARIQLSFVLEGVICQQLIPRIGGGRILAIEMMFPTHAIRHLIREDKMHQIYSQIQVGQPNSGLQTLNRSLADLYERGFITQEHALSCTSEPNELQQMLSQVSPKGTKRTTHPLLRN
jgi:twitching motility protein PilT